MFPFTGKKGNRNESFVLGNLFTEILNKQNAWNNWLLPFREGSYWKGKIEFNHDVVYNFGQNNYYLKINAIL